MTLQRKITPAHPASPDTCDYYPMIERMLSDQPESTYIEINAKGMHVKNSAATLFSSGLNIYHALTQEGLCAGDTLVIVTTSIFHFLPAFWGGLAIGGITIVPLHASQSMIERQQLAPFLDSISQRFKNPILLTSLDKDICIHQSTKTVYKKQLSIQELMTHQHPNAGKKITPAPSTSDIIFRTSGTTSTPKLVAVNSQTIYDRTPVEMRGSTDGSSIVYMPFDGLSLCILVMPNCKEKIFLQPDRFAARPIELLEAAEKYKLSALSMTCSFAARLMDDLAQSPDRYDLSHLKSIGLGGEMVAQHIITSLNEILGQHQGRNLVFNYAYGMTELGLISNAKHHDLNDANSHENKTLLGHCRPGVALRVVDSAGQPLPDGKQGNVEVLAPLKVFSSYYGDMDATLDAFTSDGWFKTGDIGMQTKNGLCLTGRAKNTIISNGKNIALESIEELLRELPGIRAPYFCAAPVRSPKSATDELAVFFSPRVKQQEKINTLCRKVARAISSGCGLPVKHMFALGKDEFEFSATGKILRPNLINGFYEKRWPAQTDYLTNTKANDDLKIDPWLRDLWQTTLDLPSPPEAECNFFDYGGDSLLSARLILQTEQHYKRRIKIEPFFRNPTLKTLARLSRAGAPPVKPQHSDDILQQLALFMASWQGKRSDTNSLIVGKNLTGDKPPLFIVCQAKHEFETLAKYIGPDQPIYAMRSLIEITKNYGQKNLKLICDAYQNEMTDLIAGREYRLAGVCQAGVIAVELARRFTKSVQPPLDLSLIEWAFDSAPYSGNVRLIYCSKSATAEIYSTPQISGPDWRESFPQHHVSCINAGHLEAFEPKNITALIDAINEKIT